MNFFSSKVLTAALLSLSSLVSAQSQAELYPKFHQTLATLYPDVEWEAHKVQSGNFNKTLFHLTGLKSEPYFEATKQPVLVVGGGISNVLSYFTPKTTKALSGKSKLDIVLEWEDTVAAAVGDGDELIPYLLQSLQDRDLTVYHGLCSRVHDRYGLDLDAVRQTYTAEVEEDDSLTEP